MFFFSSLPHSLQDGVHDAHHVQRGEVALQAAKLLLINEVPHVSQGEARHLVPQRQHGVYKCYGPQLF